MSREWAQFCEQSGDSHRHPKPGDLHQHWNTNKYTTLIICLNQSTLQQLSHSHTQSHWRWWAAHQEHFGVQCFAQGHFGVQPGGPGTRNSDLPITGRPALLSHTTAAPGWLESGWDYIMFMMFVNKLCLLTDRHELNQIHADFWFHTGQQHLSPALSPVLSCQPLPCSDCLTL